MNAGGVSGVSDKIVQLNILNAKLNPICPSLALCGAHHILQISS